MKIVLLGAPGAGKGTQAQRLTSELGVPHVSTGEYFRKIIEQKTELGLRVNLYIQNGQLVPDEIVAGVVAKILDEPDCKNGFLLDGYPRTLFQAEHLKKLCVIDHCLYIKVDSEKMVKRITGRRTCSVCGKNFHISFHSGDGCDCCKGLLIQRDDDREETVRKRLLVYEAQTAPLIDFYKKEGILREIDGSKLPDEVFKEILKIIR